MAAVLLVVLVLASGAADLARVFVAASRVQTAADAAALAAAQSLAYPIEVAPADAAAEYATRNGGLLRSCVCPAGSFEALVRVQAPIGPLLLLRDDAVVTAEARAVVELPSG
jgi:uncharacterized membrane protein